MQNHKTWHYMVSNALLYVQCEMFNTKKREIHNLQLQYKKTLQILQFFIEKPDFCLYQICFIS